MYKRQGFKYIGDIIADLEQKEGSDESFLLGFEESYGYLPGGYVRDKDAVAASMLICQMASYYKRQGKTLVDVMNDLYEDYGYYQNVTLNVAFEEMCIRDSPQPLRGLQPVYQV